MDSKERHATPVRGADGNATPPPPGPLAGALERIPDGATETARQKPKCEARATPPVDHALYRIPGFCSLLTDYTLSTAPAPNLPAAFAGSLAALSFLAGRKYLGANCAFPNLYLIVLGESGCGKDMPRQVNARLAARLETNAENFGEVIDGFSSGAGLIDALRATPLLLSQFDEIKELFASLVPRGNEVVFAESKSAALLKVFSSAGGYLSRNLISAAGSNKADKLPRTVRAPHLTLFGTGTPKEVYDYITPEMLGDGLAGRMLFVEADPFAGSNLDANQHKPFPDDIVELATKLLIDKMPVSKKLDDPEFDIEHDFRIVPFATGGREAWRDYQTESDARRLEIGKRTDALARSRAGLFAREVELAGKCALLYALSEAPDDPAISPAAVAWASRFVREHQSFVFDRIVDNFGATPEGKAASKIRAKIRDAGGEITKSDLGRAFLYRTDRKSYLAGLDWLIENGEVEQDTITTRTKTRTVYRLATGEGGEA